MRVPRSRGPLSRSLIHHLQQPPHQILDRPRSTGYALTDEDLGLALLICYELANGGIDGIDDRWEWEPSLIAYRAKLEELFESALLAQVRAPAVVNDVAAAIRTLIDQDESPSLSEWMSRNATPEQFREFIIHRSLYQLREADPHTWAIPRLRGEAKAAMVMVQADEYGNGIAEKMHSSLFRNTMQAFELDTAEGVYIDLIPGVTIASMNLMHFFGMHRRHLGAICGHLAAFEMTSTGPNQRYGDGLRRLGFGPDATNFFDEHVTADAIHERVACDQLAQTLADTCPERASDIVFGAQSLLHLEGLFASRLLECWAAGRSSLRTNLESPRSISAA